MVKTTFNKLFKDYNFSDLIKGNYILSDIITDKNITVFVNYDENKVIIVVNGIHFKEDKYDIIFNNDNPYIKRVSKTLEFFIDVIDRNNIFIDVIDKIEDKYSNMEKHIIGYSMGGILCSINKDKILGYKVITLNSHMIEQSNKNYVALLDIFSLSVVNILPLSDTQTHQHSNIIPYDTDKLLCILTNFIHNQEYFQLFREFHNPANLSNNTIIII